MILLLNYRDIRAVQQGYTFDSSKSTIPFTKWYLKFMYTLNIPLLSAILTHDWVENNIRKTRTKIFEFLNYFFVWTALFFTLTKLLGRFIFEFFIM